MRIIHTGDVHLGVTTHSGNRLDPATGLNVRVADFVRRWHDCCQYAVDTRADALLFAGDAFRDRNPDSALLNAFAQGVRMVADQMPVVLLTGNHDVPGNAGRAHALSVFQALEVKNVYVADRPQTIHLVTASGGHLEVACLPWPAKGWLADYAANASLAYRDALLGAYLEQEIATLAERAQFSRRIGDSGYTILLSHIGVSEAEAGGERGMMLGRDVTLPLAAFRKHADAFDYVALGHVHKCQMWPAAPGLDGAPWMAYCGSLDRVDFAEADDPKGWLDVELGTKTIVSQVEGYGTTARRFVEIEADCRQAHCRAVKDPTTYVLAEIAGHGDLTGAVVKLTIHLTPEQDVSAADLSQALAGAWHVAPLVKDVERTARMRLGADAAEVLSLEPAAALDRWLDLQTSLSAERRAQLVEVATALMRDVDGGKQ